MKIVLDAGHGPNTLGKRTPDGTMKEFEFNSVVCDLVKEKLGDYENVQVLFTHSSDRDVPLKERTSYANEQKADLFLSIHANAYGQGWNDVRGIETYVYETTPTQALHVAANIQNLLIRYTGAKNRNVKKADFHVLRETKMTAVLVECGFMTNREDAELLKSTTYREIVASAICQALVDSYTLIKKQRTLHRVQVGVFADLANAENLAMSLRADGYKPIIVRHD